MLNSKFYKMAITKKFKLTQITQTAARSQAVFLEDVKQDPNKTNARPGKMFSWITDDPKDLQGLVIDKVYTISIA